MKDGSPTRSISILLLLNRRAPDAFKSAGNAFFSALAICS